MKYALAVLTTIALTTIAAAGECNVACGNKVHTDFTDQAVVTELKLGNAATDEKSCDAIKSKVMANPGILSARRKTAGCPVDRKESVSIKIP